MDDYMLPIMLATALSEGAALVILYLIAKSDPVRNRRGAQERILFGLCSLVGISAVLVLVGYAMLTLAQLSLWQWLVMFFCLMVRAAIEMIVVLQWLIFVDYAVNRSEDHIRRHYRYALVPILLVISLIAVNTVYMFFVTPDGYDAYDRWDWVWQGVICAVEVGYVIYAYLLVRGYQKNGAMRPLFLRLDHFVLPFVIGIVLSYLSEVPFHELGASIGIFLTWRALQNRYKYIDSESGFYNREFLSLMEHRARERDFKGGSALWIRTHGGGAKLADILRDLEPDGSLIVRWDADGFLVLSAMRLEAGILLLKKRILVELSECGLEKGFFSGHAIRGNDETLQAFASRVTALVREK